MLFKVTTDPLKPQQISEYVRNDESGAISIFLGVVRNNSLGRRVLYLEYDAYPKMAEKVMRQIADEVTERWPLSDVAIQHRVGRLEIGEVSLAVAVSSPHRREAFDCCQQIVERIKEILPIWKKEVWEDGEVWVEGDQTAHHEPA